LKKAPFIILSGLATAVVIGAALQLPARFRLESASPSGGSYVRGLKFQGRDAHAMDGMLRLFVSHDHSEFKQQTSIPWGRNLAIEWNESRDGDVFVVEKDGHDLIEFHILGSAFQCTKGSEYLAPDPYE
jgi:hypothetical protein